MPITVVCGQCQLPLEVDEQYAGKRGKCPKCQAIVPIPAAGAAKTATVTTPTVARASSRAAQIAGPPPAKPTAARPKLPAKPGAPSPQQLRDNIFSGFRAAAIERVGTTPLYLLGTLLTTILMIVLPLIYLAIIGLVCVAVWWHLTHSYTIIGAVHGRGALMAIVVYLAPIVIGGIVIVFMFKPLFAPPAKEGRRRSLTPTSDPLLFEFVERICALVGAAMPRRIDVDCEINASASFRRGWLSLISGRDLVLTIGMPLAAGLSLQQFAGVLAHEFGHFSQGAGMRLTYIIRSINFWFVRVVYQRDAWDEWLETAADGVDLRVGWVIYAARACVWLTRRILWALMYIGHLVAGFMLRQMEFDADKYETRVAGSNDFAATSRQLRLLSLAWHGAQSDLASYHRDGRLVDNMPRLLMSNLQQLPKEAQEFVSKMAAETNTGWFDSHPSDKDRIAASQAEQAAGVFHSDLPARVLFSSFDAAAKGVTWDYYCSIFGKMIDPKTLHPTEELLARTESEQSTAKARDRFFGGTFTVLRPLRLPVLSGDKTQHPTVWQSELAQARQTMESLIPSCRDVLAAYDKADTRFIQSRQAKSVLGSGVSLQAAHFEATYHSTADASRLRDAAISEMSRLGNQCEELEEAAGRRLRAALMLLSDPACASGIQDAEPMAREGRELLSVVSQVANMHASIMELRNNNATLAALLGHISGNERNESLVREILDYAARVRKQMTDLKSVFERVDYPFDHAAGQMSISSYLIKVVPLEDQIGAVYETANEMVEKLLQIYARAISRLCVIAEAVEAKHGYQPLPAATSEAAV